MTTNPELIRMHVKGLMMDSSSNGPIVILRDEDSSKFLPIWIGFFEANAIALRLEGAEPPRPMTHDLMASLLDSLRSTVLRIIISSLENNTFFAEIVLEHGGEELIVDSRPSDAIALALRADAPIFVSPEVLAKALSEDQSDSLQDEEKLKKYLEDLDPDDLGKYTM